MPKAKQRESRLISDVTALAEKLSALGRADERFVGGARVIASNGAPGAADAVLAEIDDTVLERDLIFKSGGRSITLVAAGRRLRGISAASGSADDVLGKTLSREDPALITAVYDVIMAHLDGTDEITVESLPPAAPFGKGGERGISASGLASIWADAANAANLPPMARFVQSVRVSASAVLHLADGGVADSHGDVDDLQDIWESRITDFLAAYDAIRGDADGEDRLLCFDGAMGPAGGLAIALLEGEAALVTYPDGGLGAVYAAWSAATR